MTVFAVAQQEWRRLLRDGRFLSTTLIATLLLVVAALASASVRDRSLVESREAQANERRRWLSQGRKNPHSAAHWGLYAFKPTAPLSLIDPGVEPFLGVSVWLEAHKQNLSEYRPADEGGALRRLGGLTPARVLQILLPLLLIILTYSSICGEREAGTFRLLLSLGVSRRQIVAGKALALGSSALLLLSPALILVWQICGTAVADVQERGLALLGVYTLWLAFYLGLGLLVSSLARSSRQALLWLLSFWFWNSFMAPRLAAEISARRWPEPSAVQFASQLEETLERGEKDQKSSTQTRREQLRQSLAKTKIGFEGAVLQREEQRGYPIFDRYFGGLYDSYDFQNQAFEEAGWIAPALPLQALSTALAQTDVAHQRDFLESAERFRRQEIGRINQDLMHHSSVSEPYEADDNLWAQIPEFRYSPPPCSWALASHVQSMTILLSWTLACWLALALSLRRQRVDA